MTILYALSSRCNLYYKLCCTTPRVLTVQTSFKSFLPNKQPFQTSSRCFSLDGFYYSISSSTPVLTLQNVLLDFHSFSGFPWWAIIMLTTFGIRSAFVFPLAVHQNQVIARLANVNEELNKMVPQMNAEVNYAAKKLGWDESGARAVFRKSMRDYYRKFIIRDNCHPFKTVLLALFQIPFWICFSVSLRNLTFNSGSLDYDSQLLQQQLKSEGTLWFTDLTSPDPFLIPVFLAFVNLSLIEIHALRRFGKETRLQKYLLYAMRFIALCVAGVATLNPSSVTFYWLCSSTFGLAQSIVLMSPRFRHILRIPRTANESSTPYKDIVINLKRRFVQ